MFQKGVPFLQASWAASTFLASLEPTFAKIEMLNITKTPISL